MGDHTWGVVKKCVGYRGRSTSVSNTLFGGSDTEVDLPRYPIHFLVVKECVGYRGRSTSVSNTLFGGSDTEVDLPRYPILFLVGQILKSIKK